MKKVQVRIWPHDMKHNNADPIEKAKKTKEDKFTLFFSWALNGFYLVFLGGSPLGP